MLILPLVLLTLLIGGITTNSNAQWVLKGDSVCTDTATFVSDTKKIQILKYQREYLIQQKAEGDVINQIEMDKITKELRRTKSKLFWNRLSKWIGYPTLFIIGRYSTRVIETSNNK